jgi:hypothetical protein
LAAREVNEGAAHQIHICIYRNRRAPVAANVPPRCPTGFADRAKRCTWCPLPAKAKRMAPLSRAGQMPVGFELAEKAMTGTARCLESSDVLLQRSVHVKETTGVLYRKSREG